MNAHQTFVIETANIRVSPHMYIGPRTLSDTLMRRTVSITLVTEQQLLMSPAIGACPPFNLENSISTLHSAKSMRNDENSHSAS